MRPHPSFRLFATTNTVGLGDTSGLYHGTQQINQGQMDRWNIVAQLNYLEHDAEVDIVLARCPEYHNEEGARPSRRWSVWPICRAPASWPATSRP